MQGKSSFSSECIYADFMSRQRRVWGISICKWPLTPDPSPFLDLTNEKGEQKDER